MKPPFFPAPRRSPSAPALAVAVALAVFAASLAGFSTAHAEDRESQAQRPGTASPAKIGSNPFGKRAGDKELASRYGQRTRRDWNYGGYGNRYHSGSRYGEDGNGARLGTIEYVPTCFYRTGDKTIAYNFRPVYRPANSRNRQDLRIDDVGMLPKYRLSQPAVSPKQSGAKDRVAVKQRNITPSRRVSVANQE